MLKRSLVVFILFLVACVVWADNTQPLPEPTPMSTIIPIMPSATMMPNPTVFPKQDNLKLPIIKPVNNGILENVGIYSQGGNLQIDRYTTLLGVQTSSMTVSSDTVTGILTVPKGINSTDAAQFSQLPVFTNWALYTPSIAGCGTVSNVVFVWKQMGDHIFVKGSWKNGTVTASLVTIQLPNSTSLSGAHTGTLFLLGMGQRLNTGANTTKVITDELSIIPDPTFNDTTHVYLSIHTGSNVFTADNGNTMFNNNDSVSVFFDYQI